MNELIKLIKELFGEDRIKTGVILIAIAAISGLVSMTAYFSAVNVPMWEATVIDWLKHTLHIALYASGLYWTAGKIIATDAVKIESRRIEEKGGKVDAKFLAVSNIFWFMMFISQLTFMAFWYPIVFGDKPLIGSILPNAYILSIIAILILDKITNKISETNIKKARAIDSIAMVMSIAIFLAYIMKGDSGITGLIFIVNTVFLGVSSLILARAERQGKMLIIVARIHIAIMLMIMIPAYFGGFVYEEIPSRKLGGMPISAEVKTRGKISNLEGDTQIIHETESHIYLRGKSGDIIRIPQSEVLSIETQTGWQDIWQTETNKKEEDAPQPENKLQSEDSPNQIPEDVPEGALQTNPTQPSKGHENQRTKETRTH